MAFEGLDPASVTQLATTLSRGADRLDEIRRIITGQLRSGQWMGPDADRMCHDWDAMHSPALSACEQVLRELAGVARQNVADQERTSETDGARGAPLGGGVVFGDGGSPGSGVWDTAKEYFDKWLEIVGTEISGLGLIHALGEVIPAADLEKLAKGLPEFAKDLGPFMKVAGPISLAIDSYTLYNDRGHPDEVAYDQVMVGLDVVSTGILAAGAFFPPAEVVLAPISEGVDLVSGAMGVLGEIPGVKHYGGAAIAGVEHYVTKSFVDDYENPFAHPLETITSFAVSPAAATTAIAAGAVHDSVGVISKVGGGAIHEGGKLLSKIGGLF